MNITPMKKVFFLLFCGILYAATFPLQAKRVDPAKAEKVAQGYVQHKRGTRTQPALRLRHAATGRYESSQPGTPPSRMQRLAQPTPQDTVFYYVFNIDETAGGGFVIVAGDDAARPVLGYSANGTFDEDNLPPNVAYWMNFLQEQIEYAQTNNLKQSDATRTEWETYASGSGVKPLSSESVAPLIQTIWGQGHPYNLFSPQIEGLTAPAGCVATTMAQIMNYHQFPTSGGGRSEAYTTPSGIDMPSVSFEADYDWANMLHDYWGDETQQEIDAVATLMYHCGLSVKMQYDAFVSNASPGDVYTAMTTYFGYDRSMQFLFRDDHNDIGWETILRKQLDAGLPIYYGGYGNTGGHAFICDGYAADGTFHFNWGWNGSFDGYFVTSALHPGDFYDFNSDQQIIINIKPLPGVFLKELNISAGTLVPEFSPFVFDYSITVDASVESIDITGVTNIPDATVIGNVTGYPLDLGNNEIILTVTAPDSQNQTYAINVLRGKQQISFSGIFEKNIEYLYFAIMATEGKDFTIDWGDGQSNVYTGKGGRWSWHQYGEPDPRIRPLHSYATEGRKNITITANEPDCQLTVFEMGRSARYIEEYEHWFPSIDNLDVTLAPALIYIHSTEMPLTFLDVKHNKLLELLNIYLNDYTYSLDLDVITNGNGPKIKTIDVSKNKNLFVLNLKQILMESLDVSDIPGLSRLYVHFNQLKTLDLSNNPKLDILYCDNNLLTSLDVSNNVLWALSCHNNALSFANLYALSQEMNSHTYTHLGTQTLPTGKVEINTIIPVDTVFYGVNTEFVIIKDGISAVENMDYHLSGGYITFITEGLYRLEISNPAIISSSDHPAKVVQTFMVAPPPSTDATLSSLSVSSGSLTPAFAAEVTEYSVDVAYNVTNITVTGIASHEGATVTGNVTGMALVVG